MKNDVLIMALKKRRGKDRMKSKRTERKATAGLDSDDLKETETLILGEGVHKKNLKDAQGNNSSDELAPSSQEVQAKGIDTGKKKKKLDDDIFDERSYRAASRKSKPSNLTERMQLNLGKKLNY